MLQRVLHLNLSHLLPGSASERTAGCSQKNLVNPAASLSVQALEHSAVLTVHRQDPDSHFFRKRHNQMSGRHKCFLVGQGNVLPCLHGSDGGPDSEHSHNGCHHNLSRRFCAYLDQTVHPGHNLHIQVPHRLTQLSRCLLLPYGGQFGPELPDLLFQKLHISPCRQGSYLYILIRAHHF